MRDKKSAGTVNLQQVSKLVIIMQMAFEDAVAVGEALLENATGDQNKKSEMLNQLIELEQENTPVDYAQTVIPFLCQLTLQQPNPKLKKYSRKGQGEKLALYANAFAAGIRICFDEAEIDGAKGGSVCKQA